MFYCCRNLRQKNIVQYMGYAQDDEYTYLVMDHYTEGNLQSHLEANPNLSFEKRLIMALDIARGMSWCVYCILFFLF